MFAIASIRFSRDDTDEGTSFAANASTQAQVSSFLMDNFPQLSTTDTDAINTLYPLQTPAPFANHAAFFPSAAAAYGETTFICPGLAMSAAISQYTKSWNYRSVWRWIFPCLLSFVFPLKVQRSDPCRDSSGSGCLTHK